jgi:hypothetical protein
MELEERLGLELVCLDHLGIEFLGQLFLVIERELPGSNLPGCGLGSPFLTAGYSQAQQPKKHEDDGKNDQPLTMSVLNFHGILPPPRNVSLASGNVKPPQSVLDSFLNLL